MSDIAITCENLGKEFRLGQHARSGHLRDAVANFASASLRRVLKREGTQHVEESNTIWALKNVSFEIKQGEIIGIIGRNGAGKSTLLKILSRIMKPSVGIINLKGRVGSLLEVGTGFHPDLTGRENIFLNGAILGMRRNEIKRNLDAIVEFAELKKFIDTPVKRYSTGMYMRLAFSVAAHLESEILLVDEVLAVGDILFQKKCLGKMGEVAKDGRTVLLVSHNMSALLRLCGKSLLLESGELAMQSTTSKVVEHYLNETSSLQAEKIYRRHSNNASPFRPMSLRTLDTEGKKVSQILAREPFIVEVEYELLSEVRNMRVEFYFYSSQGEFLFSSVDIDSYSNYEKYFNRRPGRYISRCVVPADYFNEGKFIIGLYAGVWGLPRFFLDEQALSFTVDAMGGTGSHSIAERAGFLRPNWEWSIECIGKN